jgi:hypothetical protein
MVTSKSGGMFDMKAWMAPAVRLASIMVLENFLPKRLDFGQGLAEYQFDLAAQLDLCAIRQHL